MAIKTKLNRIEQNAKERALAEVILAATGNQWQNMTEAERKRMQEGAQRIGAPIVIIDR